MQLGAGAPRQHDQALCAVLVAVLASLGLPACDRDTVSHARVPKGAEAAEPEAPSAPAPPSMPAAAGELPAPPKPLAGQALAWTLPPGWTASKAGGGMRYATLKPPGAGQPELSIVVLPGAAGGELANINRWRAQISLPPLDDATLPAARKALQTAAGPVGLYDMAGDGAGAARMLAAILTTADGNTWFIKQMGTTATIAPVVADYTAIVQSLRLE